MPSYELAIIARRLLSSDLRQLSARRKIKKMDESWRMRMGMPTAPPPTTRHMPEYAARRSTEDAASHRRKPISDDPLNPEDFNHVFGGPPRTILSRQFSTGFSRSSSSTTFSYEEIFRPSDKSSPATRKSGRSLPEFRIPGQTRKTDHSNQNKRQNKGFYSDIFGLEDDQRVVRSRSRSKASSSSVLSSEELSPLRPPFDYDVSFASKLRPINVRSEWTSKRTGMGHEEHQRQQQQHMSTPPFAGRQPFYGTTENNCPDNLRSYPFGLNRKNSSPETTSMEPISNNSYRFSADDLELVNSPSSPVSSICQSSGKEQKSCFPMEEEQDDDDDDVMSSYVIEINSENREGTCESNGVDEAIAWAREKFQSQYSTKDLKTMDGHRVSMGQTESFNSLDEQLDKFAAKEETQQFECTLETELRIMDEQIRLWSSGKESDIRLLLSSLHHILWLESGWLAVPLSYITEISQVKKAYQKARLCLHPDKLQQRGATAQQKYIADKAFYVLQDAWSAFISQDVF